MFFLLRVGFGSASSSCFCRRAKRVRRRPVRKFEHNRSRLGGGRRGIADLRRLLHAASRMPARSADRPRSPLGYKAQASAKMLYEFITEQLAPNETGSVARRPVAPETAAASRSTNRPHETLTPTDLEPAWRGPTPLPRPSPLRRPGLSAGRNELLAAPPTPHTVGRSNRLIRIKAPRELA